MITTLKEFSEKFSEIKRLGWIKTHRTGPTGIGKTLEDLLEIPENNIDGPDFGDYELKSARINSPRHGMLTLFTKTPEPKGAIKRLYEEFSYVSDAYDNNKPVLHATLSADKFTTLGSSGRKIKIACQEERIYIQSENRLEDAYWSRETLKKAFDKKYTNTLVYVRAENRGSGKEEEFRFVEAYELADFSYDSIIQLLHEGIIKIDIRIGQYSDGRLHDHGTAFRIPYQSFARLFSIKNAL